MARQALIFGVILVLLGIGGYFGTGRESITALIPAFIGAPLILLGGIGLKGSESTRKHTMHAAVALALLGFLGAARGLIALPALVGGGEVQRPTAVVMQSVMALVCLAFVILGVRSFLAARAARGEE